MDKIIDIRLGDALELFKNIKDNSIDLIVADPPYNLNKDYGNKSDSMNFDDYIQFSKDWIKESKRVLKPTGTIYIFMGFRFISYLYQILEKENQMIFNNWICWFYTQGIGKKKGFSPRHDDILMFTKTDKFVFNLDDIKIPQKFYRSVNNMRGANPGDVWEFSHVHYCQENRQNHPTQKPEGIIERMVLASTNENSTVLDPFSGSGTTLRVCQQLNRNCIGFELNPDYKISDIIRIVKANSSKWINDNNFVKSKFNWQSGYGAFSYSRSQRDNVMNCIITQEEHHKKSTFREEYLELLKKFEVDFKNEYVFEFYE